MLHHNSVLHATPHAMYTCMLIFTHLLQSAEQGFARQWHRCCCCESHLHSHLQNFCCRFADHEALAGIGAVAAAAGRLNQQLYHRFYHELQRPLGVTAEQAADSQAVQDTEGQLMQVGCLTQDVVRDRSCISWYHF